MDKTSPAERLSLYAAKMGIPLDAATLSRFELFTRELLRVNETMNLTAITDLHEVYIKHHLDSVSPLILPCFFKGAAVIDVGCGAGFPGLPIKLARPDLKLTLLDALKKRVDFLKSTVELLELKGVECLHSRAEEAATPKAGRRESYDVALSRAVADLSVLCELCLPFVRVGGFFVALKGPDPKEEAARAASAISTLGGRLVEIKRVELGDSGISHTLCVVEKVGKSDSRFPRSFAKIKKSPL